MSTRLKLALALLAFWLIVPFPFWMLVNGFAGMFVFWPSFEPDIAVFSLAFVSLFYGPLLLILLILTGEAKAFFAKRNQESGIRA